VKNQVVLIVGGRGILVMRLQKLWREEGERCCILAGHEQDHDEALGRHLDGLEVRNGG